MLRKKVLQKDVAALVTELEASGAKEIRRSAVDVRGKVTVRWKESAEEVERYAAARRAWIPELVLATIFVVVVVVLLALAR
jgi:hypothetical protein